LLLQWLPFLSTLFSTLDISNYMIYFLSPDESPEPNPIGAFGQSRTSIARRIIGLGSRTLFVGVLALSLICTGCSGLSTNPTKAAQTISGWVPVGTPQDDAGQIMTQHGFVLDRCDMNDDGGRDYHFYYVGKTHNWVIQIHAQDGKVATTNIPVRIFSTIFNFNLGG